MEFILKLCNYYIIGNVGTTNIYYEWPSSITTLMVRINPSILLHKLCIAFPSWDTRFWPTQGQANYLRQNCVWIIPTIIKCTEKTSSNLRLNPQPLHDVQCNRSHKEIEWVTLNLQMPFISLTHNTTDITHSLQLTAFQFILETASYINY